MVFRASGCGDYGKEGIATFKEGHVCGPVCRALGLDAGADSNSDDESVTIKRGRRKGHKAYDPVHDNIE